MQSKKRFVWQKQTTVDEETVITEVALFLYPDEFGEGDYGRKLVRDRVRSAIGLARKKKLLCKRVSSNPNRLQVQNFLSWACNRWPDLQNEIPTHGATVQLRATEALHGTVSGVDALELKLSADRDELATQYHHLYEAFTDERRMRKALESELQQYKLADEKRRKDGAKRYD